MRQQWTAATPDGKYSAQFEETLLITPTGVEVLTAAPGWTLPAKPVLGNGSTASTSASASSKNKKKKKKSAAAKAASAAAAATASADSAPAQEGEVEEKEDSGESPAGTAEQS